MKLLISDMDGTLFDTKEVNFRAYKEALDLYGVTIQYEYFCNHCNGQHYKTFLRELIEDISVIEKIHMQKKQFYQKYLEYARVNNNLLELINMVHASCYTALVTTASRKNAEEILMKFKVQGTFDYILTQDEIEIPKPDPEGFLKAMDYFGVVPEETLIVEDSQDGIQAAKKSKACYVVVGGW